MGLGIGLAYWVVIHNDVSNVVGGNCRHGKRAMLSTIIRLQCAIALNEQHTCEVPRSATRSFVTAA